MRRLVADSAIRTRDRSAVRVSRSRKNEARREHAARIESGIDVLHQPGAANEETGSNQQGDRERYLGRHEYRPKAIARDGAATTFAQRLLQLRPCGTKRRDQAEYECRHEGDAQGEGENAP